MQVGAAFLFASFLAFAPFAAFAQSAAADAPAAVAAPASNMLDSVCKSDVTALCGDAGDKRGAQMRCLNDNKDTLSPDCGAAVKAAAEKRKAVRAACKDDSAKLCPDAQGGERMKCLRDKTADLSKPCADARATLPAPPPAK